MKMNLEAPAPVEADELWLPKINRRAGPLYIAIADAIAADIRAGKLLPGQRLPPQRALADKLKIDFTTVSRAYALAREKGLVDARVGQGTFVLRRALPNDTESSVVDMSMNLPPPIDDAALSGRIWTGIADLQQEGGTELLSRYQDPAGTPRDREAGAAWLAERLGPIEIERIVVTPGGQSAIAALLQLLVGPGGAIAAEALTYPGFLACATSMKLNVLPVAMDEHGIIPEHFDELCRETAVKVLYCTPTMQNPTATTLSQERRERLVAIARRHDVSIIEDDAYGQLSSSSAKPLAALAPERVFHISTLAKCVSPALRVAFVVVPDPNVQRELVQSIRSVALMTSPLTASIARRWIEDGTAGAICTAIRAEAKARRAIAADILGLPQTSEPDGFHIWLPLPEPWKSNEFVLHLRSSGIAAVAADAFASGAERIEAIRLGLGAPRSRASLEQSLRKIARLLKEYPQGSILVV